MSGTMWTVRPRMRGSTLTNNPGKRQAITSSVSGAVVSGAGPQEVDTERSLMNVHAGFM